MKKRLLGLTLACSMAVMSLAGCGGGSSEGDATTEAPAAAESHAGWRDDWPEEQDEKKTD